MRAPSSQRIPLLARARSLSRELLLRSPHLFVALCVPDDRELGRLGEAIAARHLARRGVRILARRLRTRAGEADLVAQTADALVVVEVKTGRAAHLPRPRGVELGDAVLMRWRPGLRCDEHRIRRLLDLARELCAEAARHADGASARRPRPRARVDLVEVLFDEERRRFRVLHHPDLRPDFRAGERDFRRSPRR